MLVYGPSLSIVDREKLGHPMDGVACDIEVMSGGRMKSDTITNSLLETTVEMAWVDSGQLGMCSSSVGWARSW